MTVRYFAMEFHNTITDHHETFWTLRFDLFLKRSVRINQTCHADKWSHESCWKIDAKNVWFRFSVMWPVDIFYRIAWRWRGYCGLVHSRAWPLRIRVSTIHFIMQKYNLCYFMWELKHIIFFHFKQRAVHVFDIILWPWKYYYNVTQVETTSCTSSTKMICI